MPRSKRAAADVPVPQSLGQADDAVRRIAAAQRRLSEIQATLDAEVARAKLAAEQQAGPLAAEITSLTEGLAMWAAANRDTLTDGGRTKTVQLPSGEIGWRIRPPSVALSNVKDLVAELLVRGETRFLRTKHEVDKEALLAQPDAARGLPGVTIRTGIEDFVVTPAGAPLSVPADGGRVAGARAARAAA